MAAAAAAAAAASRLVSPNHAFLLRNAQAAVKSGRATPAAAAYLESMVSRMGDKTDPVIERARELVGDQDPATLTQHQKQVYIAALSNQMGNIVAENTREMFSEQKGMKEFAQDGTPTGENYWFEAGGALTSHDLPRDMKDDLFAEMKRDRREGATSTKDTGF